LNPRFLQSHCLPQSLSGQRGPPKAHAHGSYITPRRGGASHTGGAATTVPPVARGTRIAETSPPEAGPAQPWLAAVAAVARTGRMAMNSYGLLGRVALLAAAAVTAPAIAAAETAAHPNAAVYIISPRDGDTARARSRSSSG
jgi:hypothetical protein